MSNRLKLLVIEDNKGHQKSMQLVLDKYKDSIHSVVYASNSVEAFHFLENQYFNAIITDFDLNEKASGVDFLRTIHEKGIRVPSLLLTINDNLVNAVLLKKYGCVDVVSKFGYAETGALDKAISLLKRRALYCDFETAGGFFVPAMSEGTFRQIPYFEVIMIESKMRGAIIYTDSEEVRTEGGLSEFEKYLSDRNFARCGRSHLANLEKVESFDGKKLFLKPNIHNLNTIAISTKKAIQDDIQAQWDRYRALHG
ncbi:LytR/AlgR family response regulator transcription factor [Brevibacillus porteri]|uniref:DNA-binding response regulator n=1 Tax=Brevibacillus porteri TaxID=2126350 RepID=A0ABX5FQE3_9BACL|nr:response regulator [Brevibacillus porteri]MED1800642.1 response regulator [Brevibacillus porteri]MED2134730.1 response regulator [Brevibacillus porteri]MED2745613.1 response regulator [Brevibacillus porteri]MED2814749.1 response regulator [Brevibacillus porteri]MED2896323.1 response regulator [Brevibacillus porteri]